MDENICILAVTVITKYIFLKNICMCCVSIYSNINGFGSLIPGTLQL